MNTRETSFWIGADDPRITPGHFNEIVSTAGDVAIVITLEGVIDTVMVNPLNRSIGKLDHWINRDLTDFLAVDSKSRVEGVLAEYRAGKTEITPYVEVNHFDNSNWDFPIRYSFYLTGHDNTLLMLGRDLRPIAELQQRLVKAQLALEKDYESRRHFETRYRVLMETSRDALLLLDPSSGRITDLNAAAAERIGTHADGLLGSVLTSELKGPGKTDLLDNLIEQASGDESGAAVKLVSVRTAQELLAFPTMFRAGGDRTILCRLESARDEASSIGLVGNLSALFEDGADAMVFTDELGRITAANDAFLGLCDAAAASNVRLRNLSDFLHRGNVDMKVLLDNAGRSGRMRLYSTKIRSQHGSEIAVEVSATHLSGNRSGHFAFVMRDASQNEVLREPPNVDDDEKMQNVVALVGSSPLKDIVSATTDVIEKLCIESAIELTGNNRVAAAEMLGLSRQSLYVKLRKYDLLERDDRN